MEQIIYASQAKENITPAEVEAILRTAAQKNKEHQITGVLVLVNNIFIQVLEGEEKDIQQLLFNIKNDPRNVDLRVLCSEKIKERSFPNWAMGYIDDMTPASLKIANHKGVVPLDDIIENIADDHDWIGDFLK